MAAPLIAAGIAAAGQIGTSFINANSQKQTNKAQQAHIEKMYALQRADNEKQWHMQNEYNSPTSQMARLREAGLNPNLVYGKGADNLAAPIAGASSGTYSPTAPRHDFSMAGALDNYFNFQIKDAQADNLKVQNTVLTQEAALKAAQTASTVQNTARSKFDLELASELKQNSLDYARENLRKISADANFQISENERRNVFNSQSIQESAERILNMRSQRATNAIERQRIRADIARIKSSTMLQNLDIDLKKNGINPSDPIYMRILGRILGSAIEGSIFDPLSDVADDAKRLLNRGLDKFKRSY